MSTNEVTVLLVDDDDANVQSLQKIFEKEGMRVLATTSPERALDLARSHRIHVALTDLMMPKMSGIDLVKALATIAPEIEVVLMTAFGTIETAVESMREGAYDFVEKPLKRHAIVKAIRKAAEHHALVSENRTLRAEITELRTANSRGIVGSSPTLRRALELAAQAAPSSANVLVLGESGTGKELLARQIHAASHVPGAFVAVNLAALPETIVESELFGHERGAFTGAVQRRVGRIEQAAGGTLFLDEIGELSPSVQVKLLRVLQEGEYEPLGGKTQRASFRLITATNRDLLKATREGDFREDLYYRLNVIAITSPPLRERATDIPLLVDHFVSLYAEKNRKQIRYVTEAAVKKLVDYSWPGNVRELENIVERAVVLNQSGEIDLEQLPDQIAGCKPSPRGEFSFPMGTRLEDIERLVIERTLEHTSNDKQLAAQLLGVSSRTIYRKINEWGLDSETGKNP